MTELVVEASGWATSIQDGGRPGYADVGVAPSGALDGPLRDALNRVVGNPPTTAVLETLGGLRVRPTGPVVVATSADMAPATVSAGEVVEVAPWTGSLWGYLAVRGGLAVEPVLGSRSQDSRSGTGPPPVVAGSRLAVGRDPGTPLVVDQIPPPQPLSRVGAWPGPRVDWFGDRTLDMFATATWTVSADISRVGVRLDGPYLARSVPDELTPEGLLTGAVQVPPDGRPVVMLMDHPTTGGYPVLAVIDTGSLPTVVQARAGTALRFRLLH